jgi:large subunit ribosomal protein L29
MKATKVRELDTADLKRQLNEQAEQLFRFKFQMGMGQMEGLKKYRELRKDRARMLTVLKERGEDIHQIPMTPKPAAKKPARSKAKK